MREDTMRESTMRESTIGGVMTGGMPASAERLMKESMRVGGELRYPGRGHSGGMEPASAAYVTCHVTGIYPHLVTVTGDGWHRMPVRTISYAEMLTDQRITRRGWRG